MYSDIKDQQLFGDDVDAIYQDFSKALDKVGHNILLHKIKALNITGKIFKCLKSFVKKRSERVKVNDHLSDWVWVLPGIPQGSVLGPQLFLILMIDIDRNTQYSNLGCFTDDTKIWQSLNTTHSPQHLKH